MTDIFSTRILKEEARGKNVILDAGCGDGVHALYLARQNPTAQVHGYDVHYAIIAAANRLKAIHGIGNANFQVSTHDAFVPRQRFDLILTMGSLVGEDELEGVGDALDETRDLVANRLSKFASMLSERGRYLFYWRGGKHKNQEFAEIAEAARLKHQKTTLDQTGIFYHPRTGEAMYKSLMVFGR